VIEEPGNVTYPKTLFSEQKLITWFLRNLKRLVPTMHDVSDLVTSASTLTLFSISLGLTSLTEIREI
jgi:hypothetical protein